MIIFISSIVFSILIAIVILFQAALAVGIPWGEYAMGGKYPGKLPAPMRAACLIQIVILAFLAIIVLSQTESILPGWSGFVNVAVG